MAGKILTLLLFIVLSDVLALKLKKVVILSRHNLRTPLTSNLEKASQKVWPKWRDEVAYLTEKGALLENYLGEYFSSWMKREELFESSCPENNSVYIRANVRQRTEETARMFINSAFEGCNITVFIKPNVTNDPVFNVAILNATDAFKQIVYDEMQDKLDALKLHEPYLLLNDILEFNNSKYCKEYSICDLTKAKDEIIFEIGEEPDIFGPLSIGNSVVDAFLMSYYSGMPSKDVAWGRMQADTWKLLTKITKENQNVRFNNTLMTRDIAKPLIRMLFQLISDEKLKFAMLVGHDSNVNSIIASLGFEYFELKDQYERTPVGGKLVFQKWYDEENDIDLLRISYVYQTTKQLRHATKLSLENPPKSVALELSNCKLDENGFCPWQDFINILKALQ